MENFVATIWLCMSIDLLTDDIIMMPNHSANFTRPGIYWVPQQEHAVTLAPRYMIPLGKESNLSLTFQQAVWARNKTGGINQYEIEVACNIGRLAAMYRRVHDGDYNSSNYSLEYKFRW